MGLFSKRIEKQIESYQHELIETHFVKLIICIDRFVVGGTITAITFRR